MSQETKESIAATFLLWVFSTLPLAIYIGPSAGSWEVTMIGVSGWTVPICMFAGIGWGYRNWDKSTSGKG